MELSIINRLNKKRKIYFHKARNTAKFAILGILDPVYLTWLEILLVDFEYYFNYLTELYPFFNHKPVFRIRLTTTVRG
jgi:hypothetical protein